MQDFVWVLYVALVHMITLVHAVHLVCLSVHFTCYHASHMQDLKPPGLCYAWHQILVRFWYLIQDIFWPILLLYSMQVRENNSKEGSAKFDYKPSPVHKSVKSSSKSLSAMHMRF